MVQGGVILANQNFPRLQDIHIDSETLWAQFVTYWSLGQYQSALALIDNVDWDSFPEWINASILNTMTTTIEYYEQNLDPTFKNDKIKVLNNPPVGIQSNEVYFKIV